MKEIWLLVRSYCGQILSSIPSIKMCRYCSLISINPSVQGQIHFLTAAQSIHDLNFENWEKLLRLHSCIPAQTWPCSMVFFGNSRDFWTTRPTTVSAGSDHYFHTACLSVRPFQLLKIKRKSLLAWTVKWPSGSLMTPILFQVCLLMLKYFSSSPTFLSAWWEK